MQIIHLTDDQMTDILTNIRINQKKLPQGGNGYILKPGSVDFLRDHEGHLLKMYRCAVDKPLSPGKKYPDIVDGIENVKGFLENESPEPYIFDRLRDLDLKLTEIPGIYVAYNGKIIGNVQKFYNGKMLHEIYEDPNISLDSKIDFFRQVLKILKEYEDKGIIYQDVKPDNYIVENGIVKPIDLGGKVDSGRSCVSFLNSSDPKEYHEKQLAAMYRHFIELMMKVDYHMVDAYTRWQKNIPISFLETEYNKRREAESGIPFFRDLYWNMADPTVYNYKENSKLIDDFEEHLRGK